MNDERERELALREDDLLWTHTFTHAWDNTCSHTEDTRSWEVLKLSVLVTITTVTMTVMMLSSLGLWLLHLHRCFLSSKHLVTSTVVLPSTPETHQRTWLTSLWELWAMCFHSFK